MFKEKINRLILKDKNLNLSHKKYQKFVKNSFYSILSLGLIFRLIYYYRCSYIEDDSGLYLSIAKAYYLGNTLPPFELPFYPLLISYGTHLGFNPVSFAFYLSLLASFVVVLTSYGIGKLIFKKHYYALLAMGVVASHPTLIVLGSRILRDGIYLMWFVLAVYFLLLAYKKSKLYYWGIVGFIVAIASFFRKEAAEILILIVLSGAFAFYTYKDRLTRKFYYFTKVAIVLTITMTSSFAALNYLTYGELKLQENIITHCIDKLRSVKR